MKILRALLMLVLVVFAGWHLVQAPPLAPPHDRGPWPLALAGAAVLAWIARRRLASPY